MLCLVMVLGVFAGCGDKKDDTAGASASADAQTTPVSEMTSLTVRIRCGISAVRI